MEGRETVSPWLLLPASLGTAPARRPPTPAPSSRYSPGRAVDEGTNPDTWAVQLFRDSMAANQIRWAALLDRGEARPCAGRHACCPRAAWVGPSPRRRAGSRQAPNRRSLLSRTLPRMCSKGKVEAFRALREQAARQLGEAFPAAVADYTALRAAAPGGAAAGGAAAAPAEAAPAAAAAAPAPAAAAAAGGLPATGAA